MDEGWDGKILGGFEGGSEVRITGPNRQVGYVNRDSPVYFWGGIGGFNVFSSLIHRQRWVLLLPLISSDLVLKPILTENDCPFGLG